MFYNKLVKVKANKNNSVILCLVEIATRKGYATAMKDKEAETVLKGLKKILTQIKEPVKESNHNRQRLRVQRRI
jgi:hypothetical protein